MIDHAARAVARLRTLLVTAASLPLAGALIPLAAALNPACWRCAAAALDGLDRALTDTTVALAEVLGDATAEITLPLEQEQTAPCVAALDAVDAWTSRRRRPHGRLLGDAGPAAGTPWLAAGRWQRFFRTTCWRPPVLRIAAHAVAYLRQARGCAAAVLESQWWPEPLDRAAAAIRAATLPRAA